MSNEGEPTKKRIREEEYFYWAPIYTETLKIKKDQVFGPYRDIPIVEGDDLMIPISFKGSPGEKIIIGGEVDTEYGETIKVYTYPTIEDAYVKECFIRNVSGDEEPPKIQFVQELKLPEKSKYPEGETFDDMYELREKKHRVEESSNDPSYKGGYKHNRRRSRRKSRKKRSVRRTVSKRRKTHKTRRKSRKSRKKRSVRRKSVKKTRKTRKSRKRSMKKNRRKSRRKSRKRSRKKSRKKRKTRRKSRKSKRRSRKR